MTLEGLVRDPRAQPIPGATVVAFVQEGPPGAVPLDPRRRAGALRRSGSVAGSCAGERFSPRVDRMRRPASRLTRW